MKIMAAFAFAVSSALLVLMFLIVKYENADVNNFAGYIIFAMIFTGYCIAANCMVADYNLQEGSNESLDSHLL